MHVEAGQLWLPASFFGVESIRVAATREPGDVTFLTPDERARCEAFSSLKRRAEFVRGRTLLRRAVRAARGRAHSDVSLTPLSTGALALPERDFEISLTHSGDLAAVAVAPSQQRVGLDVERVRRVHERLAARVLHPLEQLPRGADAVLTTWTAKEAVLKALGRGLRTRMEAVRLEWKQEGVLARAEHDNAVLHVIVQRDDEYLWALALSETVQ